MLIELHTHTHTLWSLSAFNKTLARLKIGKTKWAVKWRLLQSRTFLRFGAFLQSPNASPVNSVKSSLHHTVSLVIYIIHILHIITRAPPSPTPGLLSPWETGVLKGRGHGQSSVEYFLSKIFVRGENGMQCETFSKIFSCWWVKIEPGAHSAEYPVSRLTIIKLQQLPPGCQSDTPGNISWWKHSFTAIQNWWVKC